MNIQPNNQTVEKCLQKRTYYVDFYQREYVWSKDIVQILLDDIFHIFEIGYDANKDLDVSQEVINSLNWYYLNIYITNNVSGKEYIVDGQQRLTTLTLIALKLYHLANKNKNFFSTVIDNLKDCIFGIDKFKGNIFWIDNHKRQNVMQLLLEEKKSPEAFSSVTEENIYKRFYEISKYFDNKTMENKKLKFFILFFLERLILVELKIEKDDTPMIFEVINDRGVSLKPFEILKGKLIGILNKDDTEKYSSIWEDSITKLKEIEDEYFIDYFKGKFIFKRNAEIEKSINNEYHRYIFENNEISKNLMFRRQDKNYINNIKEFIENDLCYYSSLYSKIKKNKYEFLQYNNNINSLSGQYQNILSSCVVSDIDEERKIEIISKETDRLYMLLQLNGIYDSNKFQEIIYKLNEDLKNKEIDEFRIIFNQLIENQIKENRSLNEVHTLLEYERFKVRGYDNMNTRVLRYLFARVEKYLCENIGLSIEKDVHYISTKTGHKTGYHIEHILSRNEENLSYFNSEEEFEENRNRIGGLLLLFNKDNIISSNEKYYDGKRSTYKNGLVWGKTLTDDFYYKTNSRFHVFKKQFSDEKGIEFKSIEKFDKNALEYRSKLLYEIVKVIWEI